MQTQAEAQRAEARQREEAQRAEARQREKSLREDNLAREQLLVQLKLNADQANAQREKMMAENELKRQTLLVETNAALLKEKMRADLQKRYGGPAVPTEGKGQGNSRPTAIEGISSPRVTGAG